MFFLAGTVVLVVSSLSTMAAHAVAGVDVPGTFWWFTSGTICCVVTSLLLHRWCLRHYQGWTPLSLSLLALPLQMAGVALHFKDEQFRGTYCKTFASLISFVAVVVFIIRRTV
jgi:hypothetical protein